MIETIRIGLVALRNILVGGNIAGLRYVTRPRKLVQYSSESLFLLKAMRRERGLPEQSIMAGAPSQALTISPDALELGDGAGSYVIDLLSLCAACRLTEARVFFEIGTFNGFTAYHAALNMAEDAKVYTLDLPPEDPSSSLHVTAMDTRTIRHSKANRHMVFDGTPAAARITQLLGDSARFDYSPWHGKVDVFFVDGAHSYEYVKSDTLHAFDCVHEGSMLLWHDFGRVGVNGVSQWLFELRSAGFDIYAVPGGSLAFLHVPSNWREILERVR
jgi:hypothetical protein